MATACRTRASWNRGRRSHPRSATTGSVWWEHVGTPSLVDGCGGAPFSELSARFLFSVSSAAFYLRCLSPYIILGYQLSNQVIKEILMRLVWHIQCDLEPLERPVFFIFLTQSILDLFDEMTSRVRYKAASLCISYCWYHRENIRLLFTIETIFDRSQVHLPRAGPGGSAWTVRSGDQRHDQPLGRSARGAHQRRGSILTSAKFWAIFFNKLFLMNTGSGTSSNLPGRLRHQGDFGAHRCASNRAGDIGGSQGKKNTNLSTGFDTQHPWINYNVNQVENEDALEALQDGGEEGLKAYVVSKMWAPEYRPLVYLPPG